MDKIVCNRLGGFTLLETLVALSVLAISLGVVYQVFSSSLRGTELANDYAKASMYADSHLAQIGEKVHQLVGTSEGAYNSRYQWQLNVQPLKANNTRQIIIDSIQSYQVVLKVTWKGRNGPRSIQTMTFRLSSV